MWAVFLFGSQALAVFGNEENFGYTHLCILEV